MSSSKPSRRIPSRSGGVGFTGGAGCRPAPPADVRRLGRAGGAPSVLTALVRYTRTGVRSERDIRAYLMRRGLSADETARLVALCRARSVIDDRAGARLLADHWARQGYAWRAIRAKLAAKGFEDAAIALLERTLGSVEAEMARAGMVASRARGRSRPHLARKLAARGFEDAVIEEVVRDAER